MLFEQVWEDPALFPRGWTLITGGRSEQLALRGHHMAFYAGWPKAMSALTAAAVS